MKRPCIKAILSSLLIILFFVMAVTGTLLYFGKTGMIWGISRRVLRETHFCLAITLCVLIVIHVVLNFRLYSAELRKLLKRGDTTDDDK